MSIDNPELTDAIEHTKYRPNPDAGDASLHPLATPVGVAPPADPLHALSLFYEEIHNCTESDYGDFMRKANLYMNDLMERLHANPAAIEKLYEMKTYAQYSPNWKTDETRARLLCDTLALRDLVLKS